MSVKNGAPGANFTEVDQSNFVTGASSTIGAFLGIASRGLPNTPALVTSWPDFVTKFGDEISASLFPSVVKNYFDHGGGPVYVSRVTQTDGSGASLAVASFVQLQTPGGGATAASVTGTVAGVLWNDAYTWAFVNGDEIGFKDDGAATQDATIASAAASAALTNAATFALADLETILYRVGPATGPIRTLTFHTADFVAIGAATDDEVVRVLARDMVGVNVALVGNQITIYTDQQGTGARLEFTGGTALAALGLSVAVHVGTGNVADVDHVTVAELETIISAVDAGVSFTADATTHKPILSRTVTGSAHSIQIVEGLNAEIAGGAVLGFDTSLHSGTSNTPVNTLKVTAGQANLADPGTWGASLTLDVANATLNPTTCFRLTIKLSGTTVVDEDELSMDPTQDRYIEKVFVDNAYVIVEDDNAFATVGTYAAARPAVQTGTAFSAGADGIAGIADADYEGDSTLKTGFYAYDAIHNASFMGAPAQTSRALFTAGTAYAANRKDLVFVGDIPQTLTPSQVADYRLATGAYAGGAAFDTNYGVLYQNWLQVTDSITKLKKYIPPMGAAFARLSQRNIDGTPSAWGVAAGPTNGQAVALATYTALTEDDVGTIYNAGVNPIWNHPTFGLVIWGNKDLQATPSDLQYLSVRLGFIYLRTSLKPVIEKVALFQPDDTQTWRRVADVVDPFMTDEVKSRGISAFKFVNDKTVNTPSVVQKRQMAPLLLVQPTPDSEFIEVSLVDVAQSVNLAK